MCGSRVTGFVLSDYGVVVVGVVTAWWGEYDVEELCVDHLDPSMRGNKRYIMHIIYIKRKNKQMCLVYGVYIYAVKQTIVSSGVCIVEPIKTDTPRGNKPAISPESAKIFENKRDNTTRRPQRDG